MPRSIIQAVSGLYQLSLLSYTGLSPDLYQPLQAYTIPSKPILSPPGLYQLSVRLLLDSLLAYTSSLLAYATLFNEESSSPWIA